jgi:hypothetical protein
MYVCMYVWYCTVWATDSIVKQAANEKITLYTYII